MVYYMVNITVYKHKDHVLVPRTRIREIPETMFGRIFMLTWSFGAPLF